MGNFINSHVADGIDMLTKGVANELLQNPYYVFNTTKPTPVIFYELCDKNTSVEEGTEQIYEYIGDNSPCRFKKIEGVFLYGLGRIELRYSNGETGLEADEISGECTDLPNTINPVPGCYFEIPYLNDEEKHILFIIDDVQDDTMKNGANMHRLHYTLDSPGKSSWDALQKQVIGNYKFVANNVGTNLNAIILDSAYELAETLDNIDILLKKYYKELFYNTKVQTFTFMEDSFTRIYDSYMIEFLIRNSILSTLDDNEYIYISHKLPVPSTFSISYAKTIFRAIETKDINAITRCNVCPLYELINNIATIFDSRPEEYYSLKYRLTTIQKYPNEIQIVDSEFIDRIINNNLYSYDEGISILNIVIKYMNDGELDKYDIHALENIEYEQTKELFYYIPFIIFSLEKFILNNFK